jgi:putative CocE/NonD family hydrolase
MVGDTVRSTLRSVRIDDVRVPMRDGTVLATDVALADGAGPQPVLLARTPYLRAGARAAYDVATLARAGWAVVFQDVRGRGDSKGVFDPFTQEKLDGRDAVDWCAAQPWCDGRVAMTGGSYLGVTQLYAAAARPPALKAISPSIANDQAKEGWHHTGGAFGTGLVLSWAAQMAATLPYASARDRRRATELVLDWRHSFSLPLAEHPLRDLLPAFDRWVDPEDRSYWRPLDLSRQYAAMDVAGFHAGGWYDVFCEGTIRNWQGMSANAASDYARASQRLVIGPWAHTGAFFQLSPEMDFGPAANGMMIPAETLLWMRDALDGKPVESGVRVFVLGRQNSGRQNSGRQNSGRQNSGRQCWLDLPSWPPAAERIDYFLSATNGANSSRGDGRLDTAAPAVHHVDRFLHDAANPVPTQGGRTLGPWLPLPGPVDQQRIEQRDDVLVFTSAPLRDEVLVMGDVTADIVCETDAPSTDVTVKLVDVHPDGRAFNILDSVQRATFTPGRPKTVHVSLGSIAVAFQPGHSIRVDVAASNFPRFDVNPHAPTAVNAVHTGGRAKSKITLPVSRSSG